MLDRVAAEAWQDEAEQELEEAVPFDRKQPHAACEIDKLGVLAPGQRDRGEDAAAPRRG